MDLTGQTLAGYEIIGLLGRGGMGAVYKARQPMLDRVVALKVMSSALAEDSEFVERFKREAATAAQFKHPNIVQVHAAGESNGTYYMVMEFVEGRTLGDHIRREGQLTPREAIAIALHVAEGLKYAWNKSRMIHRDIKPDNIFLSQAGDVLVGDLGLAKTTGAACTHLTATGEIVGSPHYISPEQAMSAKEMDFRADIYSLGCTLFYMLTGQTAYDGDTSMAVIMKHVNELPPDIFDALPACPRALGLLVGRMLAKKQEDRPQSYEELVAGLRDANEKLDGKPEIGRPSATQPLAAILNAPVATAPHNRISPGMIWGVGGAVVLMLAGLMIWSPWESDAGRVPPRGGVAGTAVANETGIPAPPEKRVAALTAGPKAGEVYTLEMDGGVTMELVGIPPGEFMMGSTRQEQAWANENGCDPNTAYEGPQPCRTVVKQGFWLGRTEVTVGQWKRFVEATGYVTDGEKQGESVTCHQDRKTWGAVKGANWKGPNFGFKPEDHHPVSCISWNDAVVYCEWLTETGRKANRLPAGMVYRLPTEAEWEYACRAGSQTAFWWGDSQEEADRHCNVWGSRDGFEFVSPVDAFGRDGRNKFGLADMLGNVNEWCLDEFDKTGPHVEPFKGNPGARVLRGGSIHDLCSRARCAYRYGWTPSYSASYYGFRVCCGVPR